MESSVSLLKHKARELGYGTKPKSWEFGRGPEGSNESPGFFLVEAFVIKHKPGTIHL